MTEPVAVESLRFEVDEPAFVTAGEDYRKHTRMYDAGVLGTVHLYVNGDELVIESRLPAAFELADTVVAMDELLKRLRDDGTVEGRPFCCSCGDRGCAYVRWTLERVDGGILLTMENLLDEPLGDHRYKLNPSLLPEAVSALAETVVTTLRSAGVEETTAGTVEEFERRRDRLREWAVE